MPIHEEILNQLRANAPYLVSLNLEASYIPNANQF